MWLFRDTTNRGEESAADTVNQGCVNRDVAAKAGVLVGPGNGEAHLTDILPWAVERLKEAIEREISLVVER